MFRKKKRALKNNIASTYKALISKIRRQSRVNNYTKIASYSKVNIGSTLKGSLAVDIFNKFSESDSTLENVLKKVSKKRSKRILKMRLLSNENNLSSGFEDIDHTTKRVYGLTNLSSSLTFMKSKKSRLREIRSTRRVIKLINTSRFRVNILKIRKAIKITKLISIGLFNTPDLITNNSFSVTYSNNSIRDIDELTTRLTKTTPNQPGITIKYSYCDLNQLRWYLFKFLTKRGIMGTKYISFFLGFWASITKLNSSSAKYNKDISYSKVNHNFNDNNTCVVDLGSKTEDSSLVLGG